MTPDDIRALRKELSCTAKELAATLGVEQATVLAWERADLFPTKAFVDRMRGLREKGPSAIVRAPKKAGRRGEPDGNPMKALAEPALWQLVRKIAAHRALRDQVAALAAAYPDPADD